MPARADEIILSYLRKHPGVPSSKIVKLLGISRQKVAARLSRLVATGKITRTGSTRNAKYFPSRQIEVPERLRLVKSLAGLEEDRVFDEIDLRLGLRSHKLEYTVDNRRDDLFFAEKARMQGTLVTFEILRRSRKQLQSIFDAYSNDDFEFDRTNFRVRLTAARELLSRSQAKRILTGLEV